MTLQKIMAMEIRVYVCTRAFQGCAMRHPYLKPSSDIRNILHHRGSASRGIRFASDDPTIRRCKDAKSSLAVYHTRMRSSYNNHFQFGKEDEQLSAKGNTQASRTID